MKKGMLLIEAILAIAIFLMVSSSSVYFFIAQNKVRDRQGLFLQGTAETVSQMENLRGCPFGSLSGLKGRTFSQGRGTIDVDEVSAELKLITVKFRLNDASPPFEFVLLRSKP